MNHLKKISPFLLIFSFIAIFYFLPGVAVEAKTTCTEIFISSSGQIDSNLGGAQYSTGGFWGCQEDEFLDPSGTPGGGLYPLAVGFNNNSAGIYGGSKTVEPGTPFTIYAGDVFAPTNTSYSYCTRLTSYPAWYLSSKNNSVNIPRQSPSQVLTGSNPGIAFPMTGWETGTPSESWTLTAPSEDGVYTINIKSTNWLVKEQIASLSSCPGETFIESNFETAEQIEYTYSLEGTESATLTLIVKTPFVSIEKPVAETKVGVQGGILSTNDINIKGVSSKGFIAEGSCTNISPTNGGFGELVGGSIQKVITPTSNAKDFATSTIILSASPGQTVRKTFTTTCKNFAGTVSSATRMISIEAPTIDVLVSPLPDVTIQSNKSTVNEGGNIILSWTSSYTPTLTANSSSSPTGVSAGWNGSKTPVSSGSQTITAPQVSGDTTITYTLTGSNISGNKSANTSVKILNVPKATINVIHSTEGDFANGTFYYIPGVGSGALSSGQSKKYSVNPGSSGTIYTINVGKNLYYTFLTNGISSDKTTSSSINSSITLGDEDTGTFTFYHKKNSLINVTPNSGIIKVVSNKPTFYMVTGTGSPSFFYRRDSLGESHKIIFTPRTAVSENYSIISTSDLPGYTKEVTPSSLSCVLSNNKSCTFKITYTPDIVVPPNTGTIKVTSNKPTSYTLTGFGNPPSISRSGSTGESHTITFTPDNSTSENYSIKVGDIKGFTKKVSSASCLLSNNGTCSFDIVYTLIPPKPTYSATINVSSNYVTDYSITDSSGDESFLNKRIYINGVDTYTVNPAGGSEAYTLTPIQKPKTKVSVNGTPNSKTVVVNDEDNVSLRILYSGLSGTCLLNPSTTTVEQGKTFTLTWSGTNISFMTAQDNNPKDGVWGTKGVSPYGGTETITAPQVQSGVSDNIDYYLLCGFTNGTRIKQTATITVTRPALPGTITATSNLDTTYSITPSVTSSITNSDTLTANVTKSYTVSPGFNGVIYTALFEDKPGYSESVTSVVNGVTAGTSSNSTGSATIAEGSTLAFSITYTKEVVSCTISLVGPSTATVGDNITLTWSSTNVSGNLTAQSGSSTDTWTGSKLVSGSESVAVPGTAGNYSYVLSGSSSSGDACTSNSSINNGPIDTGPIDATIIVTIIPIQESNISITSNKTTKYTISGVVSDNKIKEGETETRTVTPTSSGQTYVVNADNVSGDAPAITNNLSGDTGAGNDVVLSGGEVVTFTLTYPETIASATATLTSDKSSVYPGETFTLSYTSQNATKCKDRNSSGQDRDWRRFDTNKSQYPLSSGSVYIDDLSGIGTYTMRCEGLGGNVDVSTFVNLNTLQPDFVLQRTGVLEFAGITGTSTPITVIVAPIDGFNSNTAFDISSIDPALNGTLISFSQTILNSSEYSNGLQLEIGIPTSVPTGSYPITIRGIGGGLTRTIQVFLSIDNVDNRIIEEF